METVAGAVLVGAGVVAVIFVAPRVIKEISDGTGPVGDQIMKVGQAAYDAASSVTSAANDALCGLVAWVTGEPQDEARQQVEKGEKAAEGLLEELANRRSGQLH